MNAGIVAFAFGSPKSIESNEIIGAIASYRSKVLQIPIITEKEVPIHNSEDVLFIKNANDLELTTLQIAKSAVQWAEEKSFDELWVVAASPHVLRCKRDLRFLIYQKKLQISVSVCKEVEDHSEEVWFCEDSEQKWTRNKESWEKREEKILRLPFFLYKFFTT